MQQTAAAGGADQRLKHWGRRRERGSEDGGGDGERRRSLEAAKERVGRVGGGVAAIDLPCSASASPAITRGSTQGCHGSSHSFVFLTYLPALPITLASLEATRIIIIIF